jgi:anti-sigma factor RsiW
MRCDDADALIDAYAEGALDEAAPLEAHLAACARCRDALELSRRISARFAALPSATPSPAVDARVLAAAEAERAWARSRANLRRRLIGAGIGAAAAAALVAAFFVTPLTERVLGVLPDLADAAGAWLRFRAAPALTEARGTLIASVALLVALLVVERIAARAPRSAGT